MSVEDALQRISAAMVNGVPEEYKGLKVAHDIILEECSDGLGPFWATVAANHLEAKKSKKFDRYGGLK